MPLQRTAIAALCAAGLLMVIMAVQVAADEHHQAAHQQSSDDATSPRCRVYSGPPSGPYHNNLTSAIAVSDEFNVGSVTVELNVKHRRVGALRVQLVKTNVAGEPVSTTLKEDRLGGLGNDMTKTVFDERATDAFPGSKDEAPFTGKFQPSGNFDVFRGADSLGVWLLRIQDVKPNQSRRPILLDNWQLTLCDSKTKSDDVNASAVDSDGSVDKSADELVDQVAQELAQDVEEVFWEVALNGTQQSTVLHGFDGPSTDMSTAQELIIPQSSNEALTAGSAAAGESIVNSRPLQQPFPNTLTPTHASQAALENGQESSSADSISSSDKTDALASGIASQVLDALAAGPPPVQDTRPAFDPQESTDPLPVRAMAGPSHHTRVLPPGPWPYATASVPAAGGYGSSSAMVTPLAAASRELPGGVSPLPLFQAFRDYGSGYQAVMSRAGTQIGGVIATDYLLKEKLYGILLAPTTASPKARLHTVLGLLKKPEYKFVRMQFAMAALSTGYLLDLAEKKGIFYDAASLYSDILGDYIHDGKIKDRFEDLTKLFPAGKFMSEAAVGKVKAMGSQFRNVMLEEIGAPSAFSDIDDWGSGRMHDIMEESPDELMLTMASILRTSLMNSETIVDDVLRILDLSGDGTAPDSTIGDYSHMINKGLRAMMDSGVADVMHQFFQSQTAQPK